MVWISDWFATGHQHKCIVNGLPVALSITLVALLVLPRGLLSCPPDVEVSANRCLEAFSRNFDSIQRAPEKLFTGVDVETIRVFCSGYIRSMKCITDLKTQCPKEEHLIARALVNLRDARQPLSDLCNDDRLYEVYARVQSCFLLQGPVSEHCFIQHLNTSVQILSTFDDKPLPQLCRQMRKVVQCIKHNIDTKCNNNEAVGIVEKLVKPMVRKSSQCDYLDVAVTMKNEQTVTDPKRGEYGIRSTKDHNREDNSESMSQRLSMSSAMTLIILTFGILCSVL